MFKSKGAVVVLVWSFCAFSIFHSLYTARFNWSNTEVHVGSVTITSLDIVPPCFFLYPIFGWLADTKFGRYKVIKWSLIALWILTSMFCVISIFQTSFSSRLINTVLILWHAIMVTVLGGIIANIVQFGIDQLYDASSSDIVSFIRWWSWVWTLSGLASALSQSCFCKHPALVNLYLPVVITVAVCFDFLFNSWLIKESPPTSRPLTNIYKVLLYAIRHKYPLRSAPIDWDERHSVRLDVGKSKYGGPFTNEEVEDVKTCFRITAVLLVASFYFGLLVSFVLVYHTISTKLDNRVHDATYCDHSASCFKAIASVYSSDLIVIFVIPLFEIILGPLFRWHLSISIIKKIFIAVILAILCLLSATAVVFVAQQKSHTAHNGTCSVETDIKPSIGYQWMSIPFALESAVQLITITSGAEFITAQSPYSLKGFIFGMTYGFIGLFTIFGFCFSIGLKSISTRWLFRPYGCTFWYLILVLSVFIILVIITAISLKCYRRRHREDVHEQLLAIDYYS